MSYQADFVQAVNIYQDNGSATWAWKVGDPGRYQGFSVVPAQANCQVCRVSDQYTSTDNDLQMTVFLTVEQQASGRGGLLNFHAIGVPGH